MILRAIVGGKETEIDIAVDGNSVKATIDGLHYELMIGRQDDGKVLLFSGDRVFDCRILKEQSWSERYEVHVGQQTVDLTLIDPKVLSTAHTSSSLSEGVVQITAPMPGKVVRVLIEKGARVETDQGILVVEAMKMQNELRSPKDGIVITLNVSEGATVNAGDVLAIIE
jgi:biotin carboxyl carrier protein